jgi:membrane protease YdiL (CAAX protease family)
MIKDNKGDHGMNISDFIKRHPVPFYFAMTFVISWGGILLLTGGPGSIFRASEQFDTQLPFVIMAILAGPSLSGILSTALVNGRKGFREIKSRLLRWRVGLRWYAIAFLAAPLLMMAIYTILSLLSPEFLPGIFAAESKMSHLLMGLVTGLMAGFFEELGWTGFATPRLRQRYSILGTGLIIGLPWAVWHILPALWLGYASGTLSGALSTASYLIDPFLFLVASRVLIVWVYNRTGGSLLLAMLMHMSLTSSARILTPMGIVGVPLMLFGIIWATVVWTVVTLVIGASRDKISR